MKNFVLVTNQEQVTGRKSIKVLLNLNAVTYIESEPNDKGFFRVYLAQGGIYVSKEDLMVIMEAIKKE